MIRFKENNTVAKYSGCVNDFNPIREQEDIIIDFENVYEDSLIQVSLGGLVMTEDNDFFIESNKIRLVQRDDSYLTDNMTILIFKQQDTGGGL